MQGPDPAASGDRSGGGPSLHLTATHLLLGVSAHGSGDALAVVAGDAGQAGHPARRFFVPSPLPCGQCPFCRRAVVSACLHLRVGMTLAGFSGVDFPDRFLTPIDQPAWAALPPTTIAAAGLAAEIIDATARAGLGPGDTAVWVGEEPWVSLGAATSARRSCRSFRLANRPPTGGARPADTAPDGIVSLDANAGAESWTAIIAAAEAASGTGHGRPERRIFIYSAAPAAATAALKLAAPGSTLCFQRGVPPSLTGLDRLTSLRILIGGGYHPDLVPEALAALARGDIDITPAVRPVPVSELPAALQDLDSNRDLRLPLVALPSAG